MKWQYSRGLGGRLRLEWVADFRGIRNETPISLEAHIAVAGEGVSRRQSGQRIDDKLVKEFRNEFGDAWIQRFIETGGNFPEIT